ncbi:MAG: PilN domain-containing protein [Acidimicrobiia bacterium]
MREINLLPPEEAARSRQRRLRFGYILLGVAYIALLVLVTFWWQSKAEAAQEDAEAQLAINDSLNVRIAQLSESQDLRGRFEDGVDRIETILAVDVAWGRLLNDLGRVMPDRTWLSTFAGAAERTEEAPNVYGGLQMGGTAFDYPDAATWVRTLNSNRWPAVGAGWLEGSSRSELFDGVPVVDFSSSAGLTEEALSQRSETRIPKVPE